ncbi:helix-turn-helix transcriptional regulator [Flavobacterium sp.]|uniref:helix-turn-helix domain-containing protein n=1 Tax=Flavobacterium sp. TaxID=239 RepID=UPI0011FA15A0|nr:helix-turn-helix transcriptional regulator [Flavobacterium sp.]RZJ71530.1 MAG: XRE family transcriptional regulator [Flavobacterium sp.]
METPSKSHIGRKISRIRELRGMKQEALAQALGMSQQSISILENSEEVDDKRLKDVAEALGVSAEAIKNFSDEAVINYFNSFNDTDFSNSQGISFGTFGANHCNFNPLDKLIEVFAEKEKLYERLLDAEREKNVYLERMLDKK